MRRLVPFIFSAALSSAAMAQAPTYETEYRNFVEPIIACTGGPGTASRSVPLPPDVPDGTLINSISLVSNSDWGAADGLWMIAFDRGGRYTKQAGYPVLQGGSFYNLSPLIEIQGPKGAPIAHRTIDPPLVYHTGDLFVIDLPCTTNGPAGTPTAKPYPFWTIGLSVPYNPTQPVPPITAFGPTWAAGDNGANTGLSIRAITNAIMGNYTQVRVTWLGGSKTGLACQNVSVGIMDQLNVPFGTPNTSPNTKGIPVELLYGGAHGFDMSAQPRGFATSDWGNLTIPNFSTLVVICDGSTVTPNALSVSSSDFTSWQSGSGSPGSYWKPATQSYGVAAPSGFNFYPTVTYGLYSVEVR